jgi:hypothetical protein
VQKGKWTVGSTKRTLIFEASGGKPPGPYCRDLDESAEGSADSKSASPAPPPPPPPPSKEKKDAAKAKP